MINRVVIPVFIAATMTTLLIVGLFSTMPQHVYAQIPGLTTSPSSTSQDQEQQPQSSSSKSQTTMNGYSTYENSQFGFKIQYPSDWQATDREVTQSDIDSNTKNPSLAGYDIVHFDGPHLSNGFSIAAFTITPLNMSQYLNINDMQVHNKTAYDYANESINFMNSYDPSSNIIKYKVLKNGPLLFGVGKYQGWRVDYLEGGLGQTVYSINVYTVIKNNAFEMNFETPNPLLIPKYLPIFQKMIDSFQLTT